MRRKTSVAIIGSRGIPAGYGGFETIAQEISEGLCSRGWEAYVSCESRGFGTKSFGDYHGVRLVYFPVIKAARNLAEPLLYDILSMVWFALRVDVIVMLGCYFPPALIIPRLLGKRIIVNVDGLEWKRRKFGRFLRFLLKLFAKLNAKIANQVIVDSRVIGRYYRRNYGISPVYVPYGIREIEPLGEEVLGQFNLSKNEYYLVVGRLEPENNLDIIIREFQSSGSKKKLVILATLKNSSYVRALLRHRDERTLFLGGIYEPRLKGTLRHNCFAYIHGHEVGGTNPTLVEALSSNNRILAIDCSYNREVAEEVATYFSKDSGDLLEKIVMLERSPNDTRSLAAYAIYKRRYTVKKMVDASERLLRKLSATRESTDR